MNRIILIIIAILISVPLVHGQSKSALLERINGIKSQNDVYFWNQFTHFDADTAKYFATKRLLEEVNLNRSDGEQLAVEDLMPHTGYITIDRGNAKQFFAFITKTDAAQIIKRNNQLVVSQEGDGHHDGVVTPPESRSFVPDAFVQNIIQAQTFNNVIKMLKYMKLQGQILQYGKLRDVEDYSSFDLILFDMQSQEIITILSGENSLGIRTNMVNGGNDALSNYPTNMTAVIWYIKK